MYFVPPQNIGNKPSYFQNLISRHPGLPEEIDFERDVLIFPGNRQALPLCTNPKNQKPSTRMRDPLAPFAFTDRMISDLLRKMGKTAYLIHLGYVRNGGILIIDSNDMKPVGEYVPFSNISSLNSKAYERIEERKRRNIAWYLSRGFREEDVEEIKFADMEVEKKAVRTNRKIVRDNVLKLLKRFYEKNSERLTFVLTPESSFEYQAVKSSLKKLGALDSFRHKDISESGESYFSLGSLASQLGHIAYQLKKESVSTKLEKYFPTSELEFVWPPEFDFGSNSFNPFFRDGEIVNEFNSGLFRYGKFVTDRERYAGLVERFKQELKTKNNLPEEEIARQLEKELYPFEPIESLALRQWEKVDPIRPFTEPIENPDTKSLGINEYFQASQLSAPCIMRMLYQAFDVRVFGPEEARRISLGKEYHDLVLHEPEGERPYINHYIWRIVGLEPVPRKLYTEKSVVGWIDLGKRRIYGTCRVDAAFVTKDGKLLLSDYKQSQVLPEIYKMAHARQLLVEKLLLESRGFACEDIGIVFYGIAPPSEPKLKSSVTNRYVIFTERLEEETLSLLEEYVFWMEKILKDPEAGVDELYRNEREKGCGCVEQPLAEERKNVLKEKVKEMRLS
jgi:hypothetical protein